MFSLKRGLRFRSAAASIFLCKVCASSCPVRVRFAPSPTGQLHLGGFRTALINYLFAVKHGGTFILRIEDTDQTRLVPKAIEMIEEDLSWLGLSPHEGPSSTEKGHGPYIQSKRLPIYQESLTQLIQDGHAYECFCSETRLDLIRREAMRLRQAPRYDGKCRDLTRDQVVAKKASGNTFCVRFKLHQETVKLNDLVHGLIEFDLTDRNYEGDPIILKSDGFPTYHFANVVDDHFMEISHVFRGIEWQISTPKHLQLYRAFNWKPPEFGHLPNVVNKDGTKLSKRQGDISIKYYRDLLFYPEALTNFVTKSGGGFSDHNVDTIFTHIELANLFEISKVNTAACRLDFELLSKLNQLELSNQILINFEEVVSQVSSQLQDSTSFSKEYIKNIVKWCGGRVTSTRDLFSPKCSYLWSTPGITSISLPSNLLQKFVNELEIFLGDENPNLNISSFIKDYAEKNNITFKLLMLDLRLLLCGAEKGPPIADLIHLFGASDSIKRLRAGIKQESPVQKSFVS